MEANQDRKEFIFGSTLPDIYIPNHLPLHTYCFENVSDFKDRPCLINAPTGRIYTYAEVHLTSRKVAAGLNKFGIQQGDVILLLLQNSPEFVFAFLGASFRGAITTTANPFYTPAEIAKQATASKTKLIITQAVYAEKVKNFAKENDIKIITIDTTLEGCFHFSELTEADEDEIPAVKINPEDVVALPFSSRPTWAAILIMQKFEILTLMELVEKYRVTIAPFVPPIVLAIAKSPDVDKYDLSSIRMVISGAAPMGKKLEDAVRARLPSAQLGQGYGMTESVVALNLAFAKEPRETKSGACGTVVRNAEMKIVDPETGMSLPRNQSGEICIRGNQIMKGYLNDPEATKRTIDNDGWLHTGDIGYIDEDNELFIVDRLKELIKYKGFQVAPAELEAMLISHPNISDAAVVPMKDEAAGEVPVAFIVRSNDSKITEDEIKQFISKQVVFYKRLARVLFIDAIPKAPSGKILRKDLQAKLAALGTN